MRNLRRSTRRQGQYQTRKFMQSIDGQRALKDKVTETDTMERNGMTLNINLPSTANYTDLNYNDISENTDFDWDFLDATNEEKIFDFSDDEEEQEERRKQNIVGDLQQWTVECNVPMLTVTKLLKIFKKHQIGDLPSDARKLVGTPRSGKLKIDNISGGRYIYFGIEECLKDVLSRVDLNSIFEIVVDINIDGLPIFTSRNLAVWPIQMAVVNNITASKPFVVGIFCGNVKPQDHEYLRELIQELKHLQSHGMNGLAFRLRFVICDAPARALVKGIIQFNGRYGCDMCEIRGIFENRRMMFLNVGAIRTDASFRAQTNKEHHKNSSAFLELEMDMIKQFPIDVMHCVDLGVTKRLLLLWKEGPITKRLTSGQLKRISDGCEAIRNCFPTAFNRKPRRMDELRMWKATEFRTFLLYVGPVVLKDIVDKDVYTLFLCLSVAISILSNPSLLQQHGAYAESLLAYFVSAAIEKYNQEFCSYNVHCLLHLTAVAKNAGCLGECSAYKYENNMTAIKRSVRGSADPLIQISNRLYEKRQIGSTRKNEECFVVKEGRYYELVDGRIVNVAAICGEEFVVEIFTNMEPLFKEPCNSKLIGIYTASTSKTIMSRIPHHTIINEAIVIPKRLVDDPLSKSVFVLTLNHTRSGREQRR